ncbi:MAG: hypothetical protein H0X65_15915 [Gemmatimonadetes bacterium]|nr:hypothetical protein [Gemmatimonadota bacterium]
MFAHSAVRIARTSALFALLVGLPAELLAQRVPHLGTGTPVRVLAPALADTLLIGKVKVSFAADTLVLLPSANTSAINVPHAAIVRLEVNRRRSRWLEGFVLGGGIGAASLYFAASRDTSCDMVCGAGQAVGALAGGVLGGLLGAAVGSEIKTGPDRWKPIRLRSTP